jgi:DNA topoisomerase III
MLVNNNEAVVESVTKKEVRKYRPCPLNTVELQKLASKKLSINAQDTMKIAESLYNKGIISYPR